MSPAMPLIAGLVFSLEGRLVLGSPDEMNWNIVAAGHD